VPGQCTEAASPETPIAVVVDLAPALLVANDTPCRTARQA
jgi:hypothetical protein